MYAIIESCGKQYRVKAGEIINLELLKDSVGSQVKFDKVLLVGGKEGADALVGAPHLANAVVEGEVVEHGRGKKILIIKYRRRKGFRKTQGHRQEYTKVLITKLADGKGGVAEYDSSKRKELLMRANVATSTKKKEAKKEAAPKKAAKTASASTTKAKAAPKKAAKKA